MEGTKPWPEKKFLHISQDPKTEPGPQFVIQTEPVPQVVIQTEPGPQVVSQTESAFKNSGSFKTTRMKIDNVLYQWSLLYVLFYMPSCYNTTICIGSMLYPTPGTLCMKTLFIMGSFYSCTQLRCTVHIFFKPLNTQLTMLSSSYKMYYKAESSCYSKNQLTSV